MQSCVTRHCCPCIPQVGTITCDVRASRLIAATTCNNEHKWVPSELQNLNEFLVNMTNRRTEFLFYWYYNSTCFVQPFCPSSGVLRRTSALVHFMQLWWPSATRSRMALQCHPAPGSKRSSQLHKMYQSRCTAKNSWWWTERLPETCRVVIPIKLEFNTSVGFIHSDIWKPLKYWH